MEESIATMMACGQPLDLIKQVHGLPDRRALVHILEQPHVEELVEMKKELLLNGATRLMHKVMLNADSVLDNVISIAHDTQHREFTKNAHWLLDRVVAVAPKKVEVESTIHIDADLQGRLAVGLASLEKVALGAVDSPIESDHHISDGADVMELRDRFQQEQISGDSKEEEAGPPDDFLT